MTLPLFLTWFRLILIPVFVCVYYIPELYLSMPYKNLWGTTIFAVASITDYFDGYLARKWKQESNFGAFLDPVADKALIAAALVILVGLQRTFVFAAIIIIIREIAISALREWMAQLGKQSNTAVAYVGKLKTAFQMGAVGFLLSDLHFGCFNANLIGNVFMLIAVILTILSMFYYLKQARNYFN